MTEPGGVKPVVGVANEAEAGISMAVRYISPKVWAGVLPEAKVRGS
jgi:hypothetical protein